VKIFYIEWEDAGCETHGQVAYEDAIALECMPRSNIGYLLKKTNKKVVIAFGIITDTNHQTSAYDVILVIPKSCITKMQCIKEVNLFP